MSGKSDGKPVNDIGRKLFGERSRNCKVGVVMGSQSDYDTMSGAEDVLIEFGVPYEISVISAHRMPELMFEYARSARSRGLSIIIAGAGGAAHLPGMLSAMTTLPVLAVPIQSRALNGLDSLLSIVQMPKGVPTATFAIGNAGAANAALFALRILSVEDNLLVEKLADYAKKLSEEAMSGNERVQSRWSSMF